MPDGAEHPRCERDQITRRCYRWTWNEERQGYNLTFTEHGYVAGELVGFVPSTTETEIKISQNTLDMTKVTH